MRHSRPSPSPDDLEWATVAPGGPSAGRLPAAAAASGASPTPRSQDTAGVGEAHATEEPGGRRAGAAEPPRNAAEPPRDAAEPPRDAAEPPRNAAEPPRDTATERPPAGWLRTGGRRVRGSRKPARA